MKWFICVTLSIILWSLCDILLKKSSRDLKGKDLGIKYGIAAGFSYFILSLYLLLCRHESITIIESMLKFWPVSLFGIVFCGVNIFYFKSYKYNEVSINSVIANTSQAIGIVILVLLYLILGKINSFWDILDIYKIISLILIILGIVIISKVERGIFFKRKNKIIYPVVYATMDSIKIIITGLAVNKTLGYGMPDMDIPIIYGFIYGIISIILEIYYFYKNKKLFKIISEDTINIIFGDGCDILALLFYTMAISIDSVFTEMTIMLYPILVMLLSKIIFKEKLKKREYFSICLIVIGTILIVLSEFV